jgi:hypothetical protein
MNTIKFSDIKNELQNALQAKLKQTPIIGEDGFTLIEGFMTLALNDAISNNIIIGGPGIPIVGIVGNTSGRVYTFALKAILPNLQF